MAITGEKLRLAVGIFYEPPRLSRAIAELFAEGVDVQDMCLVGMPSAFKAARQDETATDGGQVAGVLAGFQLHNLGNLIDGCQLSASSGALLRTLLKHAKWSKGDQPLETCTILTTRPNELVGKYHDRMPVILSPNDYDKWIDPANNDPE